MYLPTVMNAPSEPAGTFLSLFSHLPRASRCFLVNLGFSLLVRLYVCKLNILFLVGKVSDVF